MGASSRQPALTPALPACGRGELGINSIACSISTSDGPAHQGKNAMTDQSADLADAATGIDEAAHAGLIPQLTMMIGALFTSTVRRTLLFLSLGLVCVILLTAYGQIRLNQWNQP